MFWYEDPWLKYAQSLLSTAAGCQDDRLASGARAQASCSPSCSDTGKTLAHHAPQISRPIGLITGNSVLLWCPGTPQLISPHKFVIRQDLDGKGNGSYHLLGQEAPRPPPPPPLRLPPLQQRPPPPPPRPLRQTGSRLLKGPRDISQQLPATSRCLGCTMLSEAMHLQILYGAR